MSHTYREDNMMADALAKAGIAQASQSFSNLKDYPKEIALLLHLNKYGLPLRKKKPDISLSND